MDIAWNGPKEKDKELTEKKETPRPITPKVEESNDKPPVIAADSKTPGRTPVANLRPVRQTTPKLVEQTPLKVAEEVISARVSGRAGARI